MRAGLEALFIAIDGVDGSGKSTQVKRLTELFTNAAMPAESTCEPGGTPVGAKIRSILLDRSTDIGSRTELLLFAADRCEHQRKVVKLLSEGITVISDRFMPSTWAYQVRGRGLAPALFEQMRSLSVNRLPDLSIILDLDEKLSLERAKLRLNTTGNMDTEGRFESEKLDFFKKVRAGFLEYAGMAGYGEVAVLDATGSADDVTERIKAIIYEKLAVRL